MSATPVALDVTPSNTTTHGSERDDDHAIRSLLNDPPNSSARRLLAILRHNPRSMAIVFAVTVVSSLLTLLQPLLGGAMVGNLIHMDLARVAMIGAGLVGVAVVVSVLNALSNIISARAGNRTVRTFRDESAALSLRVPARKLVDHPTADLVARCSIDSERMAEVFKSGPIQALAGAVLVAGALTQMAVLDPVLTAAAVGLTLTCIAGMLVASKRLDGMAVARQEAQSAFVAECSRALESVLVLRAFVADRFARRRLDRVSGAFEKASNDADRARAFLGPVVTSAIQLTLILIVGLAVIRVQQGHLSVESLVSFFMLTMLIVAPIGNSAETAAMMAETLGALRRILGLREVVKHAADPDAAVPSPNPTPVVVTEPEPCGLRLVHSQQPSRTSAGAPSVAFRNVDVSYGPLQENKFALRDVTFDVKPGSWVALTGTSGSGKSTVLSLLEKFIDPTNGAIFVDGVDVREVDDDHYRSQIGYIDQACPLFSGSVRDNLLLGCDATTEECWDIVRKVGLGQVIGARAGALDAPVGESAYALSGGERQRLAIARALIRSPRMLLLDEITSGLDVLNRDQIMQLIRRTMGGTTTFAAAHGRYGVDNADEVLVLDHGRLVEAGTPAQVRRRSALFRSLIAE